MLGLVVFGAGAGCSFLQCETSDSDGMCRGVVEICTES